MSSKPTLTEVDDLDVLTTRVTQTTTSKPGATSAVTMPQVAPALTSPTSWDDEAFTKPSGLPRIKPEPGKTVRLAILPYAPVKAKVHFGGAGFGAIICDGGACCQRFEEPRLTAVVLALRYDNTNPQTGKYSKDATGKIPAIQYTIGFLSLGKQNFNTLRSLGGDDASVTDVDVLMSYRNPNQPLQGFNFAVASRALWKNNPVVAKEVETLAQPLLLKLPKHLGRPLSALQIKTLKQKDEPCDLNELNEL
jgi:hypothetical protein